LLFSSLSLFIVYCLQDLLNQIDNYHLSTAFVKKNKEKNTHLNNFSTNKKLVVLFFLFVYYLLSTIVFKSNR